MGLGHGNNVVHTEGVEKGKWALRDVLTVGRRPLIFGKRKKGKGGDLQYGIIDVPLVRK